jgi:hypothetical protein
MLLFSCLVLMKVFFVQTTVLMTQNIHFGHKTKKKHYRYRGQNQPHFAIIFLLFWRRHLIYLNMQSVTYRFTD